MVSFESLEIASLAPLPVGVLFWYAPEATLTAITKLTLDLTPEGARLAPSPEPFHPEEPSLIGCPFELHHPGDFAPRKARCDLLLTGSAYAAGPTRVIGATIRLGNLVKRFFALASEAVEAMPLSVDYLRIEPHPDADQVTVGAVSPLHPERDPFRHISLPGPAALAKAALPPDFDFSYFNSAPEDQQIDALTPGMPLALHGLTPTGVTLRGRLPTLWPRMYVPDSQTGSLREIHLVCDTLWIDTDRSLAELTFRGTITSGTGSEVPPRLIVTLEEASSTRIPRRSRPRPPRPPPPPPSLPRISTLTSPPPRTGPTSPTTSRIRPIEEIEAHRGPRARPRPRSRCSLAPRTPLLPAARPVPLGQLRRAPAPRPSAEPSPPASRQSSGPAVRRIAACLYVPLRRTASRADSRPRIPQRTHAPSSSPPRKTPFAPGAHAPSSSPGGKPSSSLRPAPGEALSRRQPRCPPPSPHCRSPRGSQPLPRCSPFQPPAPALLRAPLSRCRGLPLPLPAARPRPPPRAPPLSRCRDTPAPLPAAAPAPAAGSPSLAVETLPLPSSRRPRPLRPAPPRPPRWTVGIPVWITRDPAQPPHGPPPSPRATPLRALSPTDSPPVTTIGLLPVETDAALQIALWNAAAPLHEILATHGLDEVRWLEHRRLRDAELREEATSDGHEKGPRRPRCPGARPPRPLHDLHSIPRSGRLRRAPRRAAQHRRRARSPRRTWH
ncbi:MAG: DUF2169 domain-containing protein [Polyangiaceae bacterium]